ncbi:MAG: RICIN domain-containing protein [Acidimicrobiales bacterium]
MRTRTGLPTVVILTLFLLASAPGGAGAQAPDQPGPIDTGKAAEAGRQAGPPQGAGVASETFLAAGGPIPPQQFTSARVFATQYHPNTPGSVEVALPDKCAKFAALRNTAALAQYACGPGYGLGLDYRVVVTRDNGTQAVIPLKDSGPWNIDDNYWDFGPGSPRPRRFGAGLPPGVPEAQAAFANGYNWSDNCGDLNRQPTGRGGGTDQFGRCVLNPAGIDLSMAAVSQLGLGVGQNEWVTVTYLWEPMRNNISSVHSAKLIDVAGESTSIGGQVIQWAANGGRNQQWRFEWLSPGTFRIVSVHSGQVLDVAGASPADGAQVIQWPWNGGINQQWRFEPAGDAFQIVSAFSNKVLDVAGGQQGDGAPLIQWPRNDGANQQWRLAPIGNG